MLTPEEIKTLKRAIIHIHGARSQKHLWDFIARNNNSLEHDAFYLEDHQSILYGLVTSKVDGRLKLKFLQELLKKEVHMDWCFRSYAPNHSGSFSSFFELVRLYGQSDIPQELWKDTLRMVVQSGVNLPWDYENENNLHIFAVTDPSFFAELITAGALDQKTLTTLENKLKSTVLEHVMSHIHTSQQDVECLIDAGLRFRPKSIRRYEDRLEDIQSEIDKLEAQKKETQQKIDYIHKYTEKPKQVA